MKRFMIAVLAVAVLFGFAACSNEGGSPADTETPVTVNEARLAAEQVNALIFADANGTESGDDSLVDVAAIIEDATTADVKASGETIVITKTYPNGGDVVGDVTLTLSGTYTKAEGSTPAKLSVADYKIEADDLKIVSASGAETTVSFAIEGVIEGTLAYTIETSGITPSGTVTNVYATLPTQTASITMDIPVSVNSETGAYTTEKKTINTPAFIEAISTVSGKSAEAYMVGVAKGYIASLNTGSAALKDLVEDYIQGTTIPADKNLQVACSYAKTQDPAQDNGYTEKGKYSFTVTGTGNGYKLNSTDAALLTGSITFTLDVSRTGADTVEYTVDGKYTVTSENAVFTCGAHDVDFATVGALNGEGAEGKITINQNPTTDNAFALTAMGKIVSGTANINGYNSIIK